MNTAALLSVTSLSVDRQQQGKQAGAIAVSKLQTAAG